MSEEELLNVLRERAREQVEYIQRRFPGGEEFEREHIATGEFRNAVAMFKSVFRDDGVRSRILTGPDGKLGGLAAWCAPDWDLLMFAAKLLRYIALCGRYENRVFTPTQRIARDERERRHAELLQRWPVVEE